MGITSSLYHNYCTDNTATAIDTVFGQISVVKSNHSIPFGFTSKKYRFKNGITTDILRIRINTQQYKIQDEFEVRVGEVNGFEYYDSDENTVMQEFHNEKYCIAVIGLDSDYSFDTDEFFTGEVFSFGSYGTCSGMKYKIVRDPNSFHHEFQYTILTWIVILPVSDEYNAADLIDIELV